MLSISGPSGSCEAKVVVTVTLNIDRVRFGLAILRRFSAILLRFMLLAAEILAMSGSKFWNRPIRDSVRLR